jgi:hypothetical protein
MISMMAGRRLSWWCEAYFGTRIFVLSVFFFGSFKGFFVFSFSELRWKRASSMRTRYLCKVYIKNCVPESRFLYPCMLFLLKICERELVYSSELKPSIQFSFGATVCA